jgi:hypothetical protein
MVPLSDDEIDELDQLLMSDAASDETLTIDGLDGHHKAAHERDYSLSRSNRIAPKVCRNAPGPDGSRKKFKKCCEAAALH